MLHHRDSKGFTLIEMVVVIMLIGILVMIATPIYLNSEENARRMTCLFNQKLVNDAIELWHLEKGTSIKPYPGDVQELVDDGYLKSLPQCSGHDFSALDSTSHHTQCPKPTEKHAP